MRSHLRAVLLTLILVLVAGVTIVIALPRRYGAVTELWLDRGAGTADIVEPNTQSAKAARNTEVRLLTSSAMAARTVEALGLDRVPGIGQPRDGSLLNYIDAAAAATRTVQEHLRVDVNDASYAVRLHYEADRPELAASIANRIADLYVDDRNATSVAAREHQRLTKEVGQARDTVVRGEAALEAYRSAIALLGASGRSNERPVDLDALETDLATARAAAEATRVRSARATANMAPHLHALENRRAQRTADETSGFAEIDGQIAEQRERLNKVAAEARIADTHVQMLARLRERMGRLAADERRASAELARLENAVATARTRRAEAVLAEQRGVRLQARPGSTAYVISHAAAASARHRPNIWLLTLLTLAAAVAAAALVAFLLERRQKGFLTSIALERALGIKVLAAVPELSHLNRPDVANSRLMVPDYLVQQSNAPFATIFRDLAIVLRQGGLRSGPLVVSISSALPDEGKTTVALCLARSGALNGERTVLVDCDVRRPAASRALFPVLNAGLVEVIEDGLDLMSALREDPGSGAKVLGIASRRHGRSVSLNAGAIRSILEQLRQRFDFIVCDVPPALALSEAREIAALADVVLLAVRQRETPASAATIAQDLLKRAGVQLEGAVLTMVRT